MPLWLRKFTFTQIKKWYEDEKAASENQTGSNKTSLVDTDGKVNVPAFKQFSKPYEGKSSYK